MKMNFSISFGIVVTQPLVMVDDDNKPCYVALRLACINNTRRGRGKREGKDFDFILIKCENNPENCNKMAKAEIGDFCVASGCIVSDFVTRKYHCDVCGRDIEKQGIQVYVTPRMFNIIYKGTALDDDHHFSNDKANELLMNYREESNHVFVAGMVQREPIPYMTNSETQISRCSAYQLAVKRKFRLIKNDNSEDAAVNCDFPYVKTWGKEAKKSLLFIKSHTILMIDGFLRARRFKKHIKCECGNEIIRDSISSDIAAYSQEFISGLKEKDTTDMAAVNKSRILVDSEDDDIVIGNRITEEDIAEAKKFFESQPKYQVPDEEKKPKKKPDKEEPSGETVTLEQLKLKDHQ